MAELIEVQQLLAKIDRPKQWIEKRVGIPQGSISQFLNGHRDLPEKHVVSLRKMAGTVDIIEKLIATDFDFASWMEKVDNRLEVLEGALKSGEIHTPNKVYPVTPEDAAPVPSNANFSIGEKEEVLEENRFLAERRKKMLGGK